MSETLYMRISTQNREGGREGRGDREGEGGKTKGTDRQTTGREGKTDRQRP